MNVRNVVRHCSSASIAKTSALYLLTLGRFVGGGSPRLVGDNDNAEDLFFLLLLVSDDKVPRLDDANDDVLEGLEDDTRTTR